MANRSIHLLISLLLIFTSLPQSIHCQSTLYNDTSTVCANSSNRSIEYDQCLNDTPKWEGCPDPSLCEATDGNNVGLAFGLTIGAGLATTLGALLPFIPFIKRSNTTFLAIGLALAAGVMLYVSFTEILKKSKDNFCCLTLKYYDVAATGCFFGGILLTVLLDLLVGLLQRLDCGCGCSSRCLQKESRDLDGGTDETKSSKVKSGPKESTTRNGKHHRICGVNKEFDYHLEGGHTPMVSSSEVSTISTPTAGSLEEGEEEPGIVIAVEMQNSETESALDPAMMPTCSSQRALLSNEVISTGDETDAILMARQNSASDTESRRHAAITPDVASTTFSENTNNYANASVNELFSNSSLLRMNAAILPETVGEEVGVVLSDSKSHVGVVVEGRGEGVVEMVDGDGVTPRKLLRRNSYSEMVEQVSYVWHTYEIAYTSTCTRTDTTHE